MTATQHLRASKHHRDQAQAEVFAAHLAGERGDTIAAAAHTEQHEFHVDVACHHEAAALSALDAVDAAAGTPGDDAINA